MVLALPFPDAVFGKAEGSRQTLTALNFKWSYHWKLLSQDKEGEKENYRKTKLGKEFYFINKNTEVTLGY